MDQQMFHHLKTVPKADITAEVFRTTYPDVSLQPVEKSTNNETVKTSTVQHYQVAGLSEAAGEEEEEVDEEDEDDGVGENIQYVQSQQVTTLPVIYQTHSQTTMVQKPVHIGLPLQTTQQIRLQQNGVIIQPQQLVYTRYTTNNGQVVNTPTPALQEVVVSNAVGESPTPVKQFVGQVEEGEVDGEQTIYCSIQCVNTKGKKPQANVQQWSQQTQQQPLSREKAKSTNITTISASSAAAVVAAVKAKAKRSPQKKPPSEPKRTVHNVKEKPTNVVLPMYSTTKGQITTIPKFQMPQNRGRQYTRRQRTIDHKCKGNVQQWSQQTQQQPLSREKAKSTNITTISASSAAAVVAAVKAKAKRSPQKPNDEQVLGTQILIIMPDKSKRIFTRNQQNKHYKIHDLVSELGVCPDDITINFQIRSQNHSDEDLDEENQREEEEMALNEAEEEVIHQEAQEDHDEELSEEMSVSEGDEHSKEHINKKPLYRSGYLAICNFCGYSSCDFNKCQRCHRKFPPNVRAVSASSVMKTAGHSSQTTETLAPYEVSRAKVKPQAWLRDDGGRSSECDVVRGECMQTYVPYLFLVIPFGPVTLTGQDYVLVEIGCVCKPKYAGNQLDSSGISFVPSL